MAGPAECDRTTFCVIDIAGEVAALLHQYAKPEMAQAGRSPGGRGHEPRVEVEVEVSSCPTSSCRQSRAPAELGPRPFVGASAP